MRDEELRETLLAHGIEPETLASTTLERAAVTQQSVRLTRLVLATHGEPAAEIADLEVVGQLGQGGMAWSSSRGSPRSTATSRSSASAPVATTTSTSGASCARRASRGASSTRTSSRCTWSGATTTRCRSS